MRKVSLMLDSRIVARVGHAAETHGRSFAAEIRDILDGHFNGHCELCGHPAKNGRYCHGCSWMYEQAENDWKVA